MNDEAFIYGKGDISKFLVAVPEFSPAQLAALAAQARPLPASQKLAVAQTYTEKGGTHTYASFPDGEQIHVARNGNVTQIR